MSKFLVAGDTHGNVNHFGYLCERAQNNGCDRIFQLGDWGFLWPGAASERRLEVVDAMLEREDLEMFFIEGNHDWFPELERLGATPSSASPASLTDRITYFPRGYRWEWDGVSFMSVGGAFSIDLPSRREGFSWWPQEEITEADVIRSCEGGPVDVMFTHDAPDCPPKLASMLQTTESTWRRAFGTRWDRELAPRSKKCRQAISAIANEVSPTLLVHGHYHWRYDDVWNGIDIIGLDCDGTASESWIILDTETLRTARGHP
jgi:hypothetical protein